MNNNIKKLQCPECGCFLFRILQVNQRLAYICVDCDNKLNMKMDMPVAYSAKYLKKHQPVIAVGNEDGG